MLEKAEYQQLRETRKKCQSEEYEKDQNGAHQRFCYFTIAVVAIFLVCLIALKAVSSLSEQGASEYQR